MKWVIDSFRGKQWFHGAKQELSLRKVRRRLNCVKVRDLLCVYFDDEQGDIDIVVIHTHEPIKTRVSTHHMHDTRIQNKGTEQEPTDLQHTTDLKQPDRAAHQTAQAVDHPEPRKLLTRTSKMAVKKNMAHPTVKDELSGEEDPTMMLSTHQALNYTYMIPPGMTSLRQWGQEKLVSGKHSGQPFDLTFETDQNYELCQLHPLSQTPDSGRPQELPELPHGASQEGSKGQSDAHGGEVSKGTFLGGQRVERDRMGNHESSEGEDSGTHQDQGEGQPSIQLGQQAEPSAREGGEEKPMTIELGHQQIQALQTQIVVLQRELAGHGYDPSEAPVPETP